MAEFLLEIVTPEKRFFDENVELAVVRGIEGDIGLMKNHEPYITPLAIGKIKIKQNGKYKYAVLSQGYVEATEDKTTILTDTAEWVEEIDVPRAEASKERAEKRLKAKSEKLDVARAEIALKKAIQRIGASNLK